MSFIQRSRADIGVSGSSGASIAVADALGVAAATYKATAQVNCVVEALNAIVALKGVTGSMIQQTAGAVITGGLSTFAQTFPSNNGAGNTLVAALTCAKNAFGPVPLQVTDTLGNTWTQVFNVLLAGGLIQLAVFVATGSLAGANTVTFTSTRACPDVNSCSFTAPCMAILEYPGGSGTDGNAGAGSATGGALSVSLTTTQTDTLLNICGLGPRCDGSPVVTGPGGPTPPAITGTTPTPTQPFFANLAPPPLATPIVDVNAQQDNVPLPLRGVPSGDLTNAWSGWFMAVYQFLEASGLAGAAGSLGVTAVTGSTTLASPTSPQPYTGQVLALNATTAQTLTLPSMPPSGTWNVFLQNIGTGTWTINPNGLNLDGSSASITLETGQGCYLSTDGVNYFTERGRGVNLIETNGTPNAVQRLLNLESGSGVTVTDLGGGAVQFSSAAGGVNERTANYAALAADSGKNIVFNDASPCTLTLPNPAPSSAWNIFVQNIGAGTLTVSRNSLTIDGAAANLTLTTGQGVYIATDGTNYFTERGMVPVVTALSAAGIAGVNYAAGAGTGNAQTAAYSPAVAALTTGLVLLWTPTAANSSTTPTFAPNGLTAKTITKAGGSALVANDLTTTAIACAIYDGTNWELQNPQTGGGGFTNPMTTKGDVIVGATGGTPARLGVGTDGQVLTAKAAATNGADWEAPLALTTTGTSGAASLTPGNPYTLNVPQYSGGGGSAFSPYNTSILGTAVVTADWTTFGAGGTRTDLTGAIHIVGPTGSNTSNVDAYGVYKAVAAGDFTHYFGLWGILWQNTFNAVTVAFSDGTKFEGCGIQYDAPQQYVYAAGTSLSGAGYATPGGGWVAGSLINGPQLQQFLIVKLNRTGTTHTASVSLDGGFTWTVMFTDTTPFVTADRLLVFCDPRSSATAPQFTFVAYQ